ncbi:hypothetical protein TL16_g05820 [Triparma laevis f. inornata]|uniref:GtrA-like protein domain-containing protein n=1 Tax=Triparma laevis f. inornata TaxID=1714386 RepID=A0A9W7AN28_9STRA|nr:hypothetical protein TL16_g05820 [Triparma laevis f. inornata]
MSGNSESSVATDPFIDDSVHELLGWWLYPLHIIEKIHYDSTPLLSGLSKVEAGAPMSTSVLICGRRPPQFIFYAISGTLCDVIQLALDFFLAIFMGWDGTMTWAVSFWLSIVFRHTSHRYIVFGGYSGGYASSLTRMYLSYTGIVVLSTVFNYFMINSGINRWKAWAITVVWTGVINFFIVKAVWALGGKSKAGGERGKGYDGGEEEEEELLGEKEHKKPSSLFNLVKSKLPSSPSSTKSKNKNKKEDEESGIINGNKDEVDNNTNNANNEMNPVHHRNRIDTGE